MSPRGLTIVVISFAAIIAFCQIYGFLIIVTCLMLGPMVGVLVGALLWAIAAVLLTALVVILRKTRRC
jgi:hypothetical protein